MDKSSSIKRKVLTVSELTEQLRETLDELFANVWVAGEVSEISRPGSGHLYLTLKDERSQLRAVIWKGVAARFPFQIEPGMEFVCLGGIDIYPPRGSYQLVIQHLEPLGVGALQLAFKQLHQKLASEGLFDPARKRTIPKMPRHVAFVTSPTGAAVRDFLQIAVRRWPGLRVTIIPSRVQGEGAANEIAQGIALANKLRPAPDVIVVGRGGGSLEDLWSFNEEIVVRAVVRSRVPIVSAVGHEIDVTLCDLAADLRALTPSDAASRIFPDASELFLSLESLRGRINRGLKSRVAFARRRLDALKSRRAIAKPMELIHVWSQKVDDLEKSARAALDRRVERSRSRLTDLANRLNALNPLAVLQRGYSATLRADGKTPIVSIREITKGDVLVTRFKDGEVTSIVESLAPEPPSSKSI